MMFTNLFVLIALSFGCTLVHGAKDHWIEKPVKEIQSCLSPELEDEERKSCRFYAAVVDAGSTGTRLHLFEFSHDPVEEHSPFRVESENFQEVKPGLSSYANEPEEAAASVRKLITDAKQKVPPHLWAHTPIVMKATAGLRLLPEDAADAILYEVEAEIQRSGLLMDEDAVGILSGTDEGVFSWFTINFLLQRLKYLKNSVAKTVVALDLGGGSTQITFVPENPNEIFTRDMSEDEFGHVMKVFGQKIRLYTHSYLGNGLIATRLSIGKLTSDSKDGNLSTHCFPTGFSIKDWDYAGNGWTVSGTEESSYENCRQSAKKYVKQTNVRNVASELESREIMVFAYFYERAHQAGLVEGTGRSIRVADYAEAAKRACARSAAEMGPEHWRPWQCLDLTYLYTILHDGYGLSNDQLVKPVKRMRDMEVSWALGAGYHLLNTYHDRNLRAHLATAPPKTCEANENVAKLTVSKNKTTPMGNGTYVAKIYEYLSGKATELLTVLRIIS